MISPQLAIFVLSAAASACATTGPWQQCGGINWKGATACVNGWICTEQNPYYFQCLQSSTTSTAAQRSWEQCGGVNWTGGTTCIDGWNCVEQNPYYYQCIQAFNNPGSSSISSKPASSTKPSTTSTSIAAVTTMKSSFSQSPAVTISKNSAASSLKSTSTSTSSLTSISSSSSSSATSSTSPAASGLTFNASFTHYGAGDSFGSPNCNTNTAACGFFTSPGFSAAVSQNLYGVGPGAGSGPACGTCWQLTGETDSSGNVLTNAGTNIIVMVNNLCPANGNPLCAQNGLSGTNQYGANVNFDLCSDSGAEAAFFGDDGVGLAVGTALQVDCSKYSGTVDY